MADISEILEYQDDKDVITTHGLWDCECISQYIHPTTSRKCKICKAERDSQPDARASELSKPSNFATPSKMEA